MYINLIPSSHYTGGILKRRFMPTAVLSIGPGTCRSSGGYSVESRRVYLTFKNSPERNFRGLLILLRGIQTGCLTKVGD